MTEPKKFEYIHSKGLDLNVLNYLEKRLNNLDINILGQRKGKVFDLMAKGYLEGWCWQTTESSIVFLNDDDYIERGNILLDESKPLYYHSWICFKYENKEYVLDACLNILCKKELYHQLFEAKVLGYVYAKEVKEELIRQVINYKSRDYNFLKIILKEEYDNYMKDRKNEVVCHAPEDPFTPMYRNNSGYKLKLENKNIKKIDVHYYYN